MCGIVGIVGLHGARDLIFAGLKNLEYRGYDSSGIALLEEDHGKLKTNFVKLPGKLENLRAELPRLSATAKVGIGHTRWATHGEVNQVNSHPHRAGTVTIVHNGIIENHSTLRGAFAKSAFLSETDTEVFAHLLAKSRAEGTSLFDAVRLRFQELEGNSAFVVMDESSPETIVAVRKGASPLVVGRTAEAALVASDVPALLKHTRDVYYLQENEVAVLGPGTVGIFDLSGAPKRFEFTRVDWDPESIDKQGFPHFMLKEIHEQPRALADTLRPWLDQHTETLRLAVKNMDPAVATEILRNAKGVQIVACGTAFHACLYGQYLLEKVARVPARAELAHEFRYREPVLRSDEIGIVVSQSGETADTLAATKLMRQQGMKVFCITNVPSSSLVRECDGAFYTNAGIEVGVASTKAFVAMLGVFAALSPTTAKIRGLLVPAREAAWVRNLCSISASLEEVLQGKSAVQALAQKFERMKGYLFIGRGPNYMLALEGALKLKELAYVHAEGFAGGELKHGPIALVEPEMLIVATAPSGEGELHGKSLSGVEEVRARKGQILGIGREDDMTFRALSTAYFGLPRLNEADLYPVLAVLPLQLLAYYISVQRGCDIDQPRNLAKSVTVE